MPMTATGVTGVVPIVVEEFAEAEPLFARSSTVANETIPPPHSNEQAALSGA
jgi:hypothetical protein